ncbi:reverse transcriptase domain-containing protein [Tanacetum coccineum]
MHKKSDFQWTPEAEEAFKQMKKLIAELPTLTAPREHEELIIYLAAAKEAISAVLMTDREGRQIPVYFVSRTLRGPEVNYTPMEKLVLALLSASKRLKRYFQAHTVVVITNQPIKQLLSSSKIGRNTEWKVPRYYWPTMHMDAQNLIRECNDYQIHRPFPRNPQQNLTPITSPWPFYKWGIDIAGPFPEGPGKVKFLIVAIDYFTKWIEAKAVATITGNQVKKFVWDNIVCRFGLPGEIISDNGKQFRDNPFKDWCEKLYIRQCFASVKHPQENGLVERANRSLGEGIKAMLDERSKDWIEELPHVLWAHRTMIKSSNGETPFSLTYDTKAIIPTEIGMPTLRAAEIDPTKNNEALGINLDLIEERREQTAIQKAKSKKKMEKYYNSRVCGTSFKPGDMIYRNNEASHARDEGKLRPKWEGPYEVKESLGKGAYKLKDCKGNEMPRTWNICNLKKCYIHEV